MSSSTTPTTTTPPTTTPPPVSPKSFSITDFRTKIGNIVRPNLWYAELTSGATGTSTTISSMPNFGFRCESTTLPGRTIATIDDVGSGPPLKLPYVMNYADIEITVICSSDMAERKAFESWMDSVVSRSGRVNYHSSYARGNMLTLSQLAENGTTLITYNLMDVYPIQISAMNLSWEDSNTYQRFTATLCYRQHKIS